MERNAEQKKPDLKSRSPAFHWRVVASCSHAIQPAKRANYFARDDPLGTEGVAHWGGVGVRAVPASYWGKQTRLVRAALAIMRSGGVGAKDACELAR